LILLDRNAPIAIDLAAAELQIELLLVPNVCDRAQRLRLDQHPVHTLCSYPILATPRRPFETAWSDAYCRIPERCIWNSSSIKLWRTSCAVTGMRSNTGRTTASDSLRQSQKWRIGATRQSDSVPPQTDRVERALSLRPAPLPSARRQSEGLDSQCTSLRQKAAEIQGNQQRIRAKVSECQATLPPAKAAVNLPALTSKAADQFVVQSGAEQRKLLRLVVGEAIWKAGELRMSFQPPFEQLRLSNSTSTRNHTPNEGGGGFSDNWRRGRDSNPR
jgi:hypothetical protein